MSSNDTHTINLSNYEEWFVMYMDNELTSAQKMMVENFLQQHPQLQEEMDLLLSTKLPADEVSFDGKADLLAHSMKLNMVDEALLLYIDNELPAAEKKIVEEKIGAHEAYSLQFTLLQQTKLDPTEIISYPNKKELYRHTERVVALKMWMRIAVAVVLILFATLFFFLNNGKTPVSNNVAVNVQPDKQAQKQLPSNVVTTSVLPKDDAVAATTDVKTRKYEEQLAERAVAVLARASKTPAEKTEEPTTTTRQIQTASVGPIASVKVDVTKLTQQLAVAVNNPEAKFAVTSATPASYNNTDTPDGTAVINGDEKNNRTPAKGFLRKVSRFLERRAGIGTVNADNEILVGAVALKLN